MAQEIKLEEYKKEWNDYFKQEEKQIKNIIGANCVAAVHVGSTAIKGMKARNIIDIMVLVKDIFQVDECNEELEKAGYELKESYGDSGRYLYMKENSVPGYQLHFYENDDYEDIQRMVAFRDYVEKNLETAKEYIRIKEQYAEGDIDAAEYAKAKGDFIKKVREVAVPWHEKQHKKDMALTMGICFGALLGIVTGFASSSLLIGAGVGVLFGAVIAVAVGTAKKKNTEQED